MLRVILSSRTGEHGYTLIELLVVLTVMALLIAATPAIISAARPGAKVRAATYAVAETLRAARNAAVMSDSERIVLLNLAGRAYVASDGRTHQLPGGIAWEFEGAARDRDDAEVKLRFFPDGSSNGGRIQIHGAGRDYLIVDHGLTGRISIDE